MPRRRAVALMLAPSAALIGGSLVWVAIDARVPQRVGHWLIHW